MMRIVQMALVMIAMLSGISMLAGESSEARQEWNNASFVGSYDDIGVHDKKWDKSARMALRVLAKDNTQERNTAIGGHSASFFLQKAMDAGCTDPLIHFAYIHQVALRKIDTAKKKTKALQEANAELHQSKYPAFRKFRADATVVKQMMAMKDKPPALDGVVDQMVGDFADALADTNLPAVEMRRAGTEIVDVIIERRAHTDEQWARIDSVFIKVWPDNELAFYLRGVFFYEFAWQARGHTTEDKVPKAAWPIFEKRLALAHTNLVRATELDANDCLPPTKLINVCGSQVETKEMEMWFERAMKMDPTNFDACEQRMIFTLPRWRGSHEKMVAFGRYCVDSNWGGKVPLMLWEAHWWIAQDLEPDPYWSPKIWPDVKASFEKFFAVNENTHPWRSEYAYYAYRCSQWNVAAEQLDLAGDEVWYQLYGGREGFKKIKAEIEEHAGESN